MEAPADDDAAGADAAALGAAALAAVLPETKLRELVLCHNCVGDDGAMALLAALPPFRLTRSKTQWSTITLLPVLLA